MSYDVLQPRQMHVQMFGLSETHWYSFIGGTRNELLLLTVCQTIEQRVF